MPSSAGSRRARATDPGPTTVQQLRRSRMGRRTSTYFNLFDFNNLDPMPSKSTSSGDLSIWEFDPPVGDTLRITMDARLEPARQHGSVATTSILENDLPVVSIRYQTRVMP